MSAGPAHRLVVVTLFVQQTCQSAQRGRTVQHERSTIRRANCVWLKHDCARLRSDVAGGGIPVGMPAVATSSPVLRSIVIQANLLELGEPAGSRVRLNPSTIYRVTQ